MIELSGSRLRLLPPPLMGRGGERGGIRGSQQIPPSRPPSALDLPLKGGGNNDETLRALGDRA